MIHALQNCPKLKSLFVTVVQVCTANGPTGLFAVKNVPVESLVDSNITIVALNQSSKSELVALTDGPTGHSGRNAVQPVPEPDQDNKLISVVLNQSLKRKNAVAAVPSLTGHHGVFAVKNVPAVFHHDHVSINVALFQKNNQKHAVALVIMVCGAFRIIKPNVTDYQEIAFDTLTMRDFAKFKSTNYILAKIDDINNYFIVSPKGLSVAFIVYSSYF